MQPFAGPRRAILPASKSLARSWPAMMVFVWHEWRRASRRSEIEPMEWSIGSQRSVLKGKGTKVLGKQVLPEETQLFLHTYSIHLDECNFHTPEAFLSERWFSKGAPAGEHNMTAFIPFSYGPTICAGKNLALMENVSALAPAPAPSLEPAPALPPTPPYHQHHQPLPPSHPLAPQLRPPYCQPPPRLL
ncbi:cytochrome P450 [Russula earlei]|uniref:Cytochrome P450 n=1 Tax=Russula earlei TaxID=71964 RepID=A0ACC0TZ75_9AGAM|nr:cytochrome P450 [Russula earlei]